MIKCPCESARSSGFAAVITGNHRVRHRWFHWWVDRRLLCGSYGLPQKLAWNLCPTQTRVQAHQRCLGLKWNWNLITWFLEINPPFAIDVSTFARLRWKWHKNMSRACRMKDATTTIPQRRHSPIPGVTRSNFVFLHLCVNCVFQEKCQAAIAKLQRPNAAWFHTATPENSFGNLLAQTFAFLLEDDWDSLVSAARLEPETFAALLTADFSTSVRDSHHCHAQLETVEQAWDCVFLVPLAKGQSALLNDTQRDAFPSYFMPTGRRACTNGDARSGTPSPATTPGGSFRSPSSTSLSTRGWCGPSSRACQWN